MDEDDLFNRMAAEIARPRLALLEQWLDAAKKSGDEDSQIRIERDAQTVEIIRQSMRLAREGLEAYLSAPKQASTHFKTDEEQALSVLEGISRGGG